MPIPIEIFYKKGKKYDFYVFEKLKIFKKAFEKMNIFQICKIICLKIKIKIHSNEK
jgi:hypothetical protein